jgi:hypothetical protein
MLAIIDLNHNRILIVIIDSSKLSIRLVALKRSLERVIVVKKILWPQGVLLIVSNIYITDIENHVLRKIVLESNIVKTFVKAYRATACNQCRMAK